MLHSWPENNKQIVWLEKGTITVGGMEQFCEFRKAAIKNEYGRVNYCNFNEYIQTGKSGVLTASGTMHVCETYKLPIAVTCGIGGLMKGGSLNNCHDIQALSVSPVSLIATSPKDMFDLDETIKITIESGITVLGYDTDTCDGYLFHGEKIKLSGYWNDNRELSEKLLLLRAIPEQDRISDREILKHACIYGKQQEQAGKYYHPAVNAKIDQMTRGKSSKIQLESLIQNIAWAEKL
ncbi:pseudouridine-5'-phosphate glycosidase [Muricomes intestini]|uniref:Pseudouridine-5'-phosphate glycosidase n=1 Tax=Muricomes intestini TaxID=1796634 RepID=A0A4R3K5W2_9FIRM|nr:pseudouridine-5'-phosphate glycosidase [Muricomes intestini]TCS78061.1 pseudouridine-5'-phosphate glycosidase [Muricomes intestini]